MNDKTEQELNTFIEEWKAAPDKNLFYAWNILGQCLRLPMGHVIGGLGSDGLREMNAAFP